MSHDWRERGAVDIGRLDEHQGNGEYRRTRWTSPAWASCRRCGVSRVAAEHFGWECAATEQREVEQRTLAANGVSGQPAAAAPGLVAARTTEVLLREAAAALRVERLERDADRYAKRLRGHQIACCDHRCTYCNAPLPKVRCTNCDSYEPAPPAAAPGLVGELDELAAILRREGNPDFALIAEAAAAALRAASPQAGEPEWATLCVECGPNVQVDEDGCCRTCGNGAIGTWLRDFGAPSGGAGGSDAER
jgi:hypothetical protein